VTPGVIPTIPKAKVSNAVRLLTNPVASLRKTLEELNVRSTDLACAALFNTCQRRCPRRLPGDRAITSCMLEESRSQMQLREPVSTYNLRIRPRVHTMRPNSGINLPPQVVSFTIIFKQGFLYALTFIMVSYAD